jgi:hypothetical protein
MLLMECVSYSDNILYSLFYLTFLPFFRCLFVSFPFHQTANQSLKSLYSQHHPNYNPGAIVPIETIGSISSKVSSKPRHTIHMDGKAHAGLLDNLMNNYTSHKAVHGTKSSDFHDSYVGPSPSPNVLSPPSSRKSSVVAGNMPNNGNIASMPSLPLPSRAPNPAGVVSSSNHGIAGESHKDIKGKGHGHNSSANDINYFLDFDHKPSQQSTKSSHSSLKGASQAVKILSNNIVKDPRSALHSPPLPRLSELDESKGVKPNDDTQVVRGRHGGNGGGDSNIKSSNQAHNKSAAEIRVGNRRRSV